MDFPENKLTNFENELSNKYMFGETSQAITLAPGEKIVQVIWKDTSLWILTEPMEPDYKPKTKIFRENSRFGVMESTVIIKEVR